MWEKIGTHEKNRYKRFSHGEFLVFFGVTKNAKIGTDRYKIGTSINRPKIARPHFHRLHTRNMMDWYFF